MYYKSAATADEIQAYNPGARLLVIVRDPIQRLLSQFRYNKQLGLIDEGTTVAEALPERPYLIRASHYEETLPTYAERFGPEQFRVVSLEAERADPDAFWTDLLNFLDLPTSPVPARRIVPRTQRAAQRFGPSTAPSSARSATVFHRSTAGCSGARWHEGPNKHCSTSWGRPGRRRRPSPLNWRPGSERIHPDVRLPSRPRVRGVRRDVSNGPRAPSHLRRGAGL
jgi:hypothetical protein